MRFALILLASAATYAETIFIQNATVYTVTKGTFKGSVLVRSMSLTDACDERSSTAPEPSGFRSPVRTINLPSHFNIRVCFRPLRRQAAFPTFIVPSSRAWLARSSASHAWVRGCATTRPPPSSGASRSTRWADGRWLKRSISSRH